MNFEKRLQRLERRLERTRVTETAVLYFEDGTTATIPCDGPSLARLFDASLRSDTATPEELKQLDLVRRSASSREPGDSLMIELLGSILEPE